MSTTETVRAWSTTAASNASADSAITSSDSQSPDTLDNNVRSIMAAVAKQEKDTGGALAAGGSANALTVTTNQVLEAGQLVAGLRLDVRATADNTSATVTFAPDSLTAANIKRGDGSALAVGSIKSGMMLTLYYNSGSSEWRCSTIAPAGTDAAAASFSAHKNGSDQTISTTAATQITFGTEAYDVGAHFASSAWTPPAGTVLLLARIEVTIGVDEQITIHIYKNGAAVASPAFRNSFGNNTSASISYMDQANGSDVYTVYSQSTDSSYTVSGTATLTKFQGTMI